MSYPSFPWQASFAEHGVQDVHIVCKRQIMQPGKAGEPAQSTVEAFR
jgi:hypothetical protein